MGGKAHIGAEVHARELLQELGSPALLNRCPAPDDEVLTQAGRADRAALEGDRDPGIAPDVLELPLPQIQVRGEQVLAIDRHPHTRNLRSPVTADRDEMAERPVRMSSLALSGRATLAQCTLPALSSAPDN